VTRSPRTTSAAVQDRNRPRARALLGCLLTSALVAAAYVAGVVVPYLVDDLHHVPLAELTSGAHDPKDLWPATGGTAGALLHDLGSLTAVLGCVPLLVAGSVAALAVPGAVRDRSRRRTVLAAVTLGLVLVTLAVTISPLGRALLTWKLD